MGSVASGSNGVSGAVEFLTGSADTGNSGGISIATGTSTEPGSISLAVGSGEGNEGGTVSITGGRTTKSSATGGPVFVLGGQANSGNSNGGDVLISAGQGGASGTGGTTVLQIGSTGSGSVQFKDSGDNTKLQIFSNSVSIQPEWTIPDSIQVEMIGGFKSTTSTISAIMKGTTTISTGTTIAQNRHADFDINVPGAVVGAQVYLTHEDSDAAVGQSGSKITWNAWVSADNTVTVRLVCAQYCGSQYTVAGTWSYLVVNF